MYIQSAQTSTPKCSFYSDNFTRAHVPRRDYHGYYSYVKIEKRRCAAKKEKNIPDSTNGIYIV